MTDSAKLDLILEKLDGLGTRMDALESRMDGLESRMDGLESRMDGLESRMDSLESNLQEVKKQTTQTCLIIENELRVNIKRIAEGHLDLSRNLHEAQKPSQEFEMLSIRVGVLESDVRMLKNKVAG